MTVAPVFVLSLPRSGSTLLQRVLAAHPEVSTAAEPWLLLPWLYALRSSGVYAEYEHRLAVRAIEEFWTGLPGGRRDYLSAVAGAATQLYTRASEPGSRYFVDKTPRYHLVARDLMHAFPDGRFVFLWRNPLAVAASMVETFGRGDWNLFHYKVDLYRGADNLVDAYRQAGDRAHALRFEDLVRDPERTVGDLCRYLGLAEDPAMVQRFADVTLAGTMGDPTGTREYRSIADAPLSKWRATFTNPLRKQWARRYLAWLDRSRLEAMGYDLDALRAEVDAIPGSARGLYADAFRMPYGAVRTVLEPRIVLDKVRRLPAWSTVYSHR